MEFLYKVGRHYSEWGYIAATFASPPIGAWLAYKGCWKWWVLYVAIILGLAGAGILYDTRTY